MQQITVSTSMLNIENNQPNTGMIDAKGCLVNKPLNGTTGVSGASGATSLFNNKNNQPEILLHDVKGYLANNNPQITCGYGEYIVDYVDGSSVDVKTYALVHRILSGIRQQAYPEFLKDSYTQLSISQLNPNIRIRFIPRTLYELFYLVVCAEETLSIDTKMNEKGKEERQICSRVTAIHSHLVGSNPVPVSEREQGCWHATGFQDSSGNDLDPELIKVAYQLNQLIQATMTKNVLFYSDIETAAKEKIACLRRLHWSSHDELSKGWNSKVDCGGATLNLATKNPEKSIGIANIHGEQIILNAIALECSPRLNNCKVIYRAASSPFDKPIEKKSDGSLNLDTGRLNTKTDYRSLSYGTSLFAGAMFDPKACVFNQARERLNRTFAIFIPNEEVDDSPFSIPTHTHALSQILAMGLFQPRTKVPTKDVDPSTKISGFGNAGDIKLEDLPGKLKMAVTQENYLRRFQYYQSARTVKISEELPSLSKSSSNPFVKSQRYSNWLPRHLRRRENIDYEGLWN